MPSLFIANTSKQHYTFVYRDPHTEELRNTSIPVGGQICLARDASSGDIDYIVNQHVRYGLTKASEIVNRPGFVGLCFNIDAPVNLERMFERLEVNDDILQKRSDEQRETTVTAIATNLQDRMQDHGVKVPRTEIELVEETKGTPTVAVGLEVVDPGTQARHGGQRTRRSRQ
jgi:hypothetical protein